MPRNMNWLRTASKRDLEGKLENEDEARLKRGERIAGR